MLIDWWFCVRDGICGVGWDGMADGSDGGARHSGWIDGLAHETGGFALCCFFIFPLFGCFCFGDHGARIDKN